MDQTKLLK